MQASVEGEPLGALLRRFRLRSGLTIEALAEASTISDRAISDLERGASRVPRRRTLVALADALALSAAERALVLRSAASAQEEQAAHAPLTLEPARLLDFIGRDEQIATALAALRATDDGPGAQPLVLVCGPGGSGKTSFAIEAAHRSGRRRLFVDLQGHRAGQLQPIAVTRLLLEQVDPDAAHRVRGVEGLLRAWREASADAGVVVVLDDAVSEEQVRAVHAASACPVVVTSRRSLTGLSGLVRIVLGPMEPSDAKGMLTRIIPQHGSDAALGELVRLCEGVPLALRIAGNRLAAQPAWSVDDFAARLLEEDERLLHLQAGDLAVESTLDLSYTQLDDAHARAFELLSLIPGGSFGVEVAGEATDGGARLDLLDDLADLGLLQTLAGERFRFHELVRLFAASRLERTVGERAARDRRERLFTRLLATAEDAAGWFRGAPGSPPQHGSAFAGEEDAQRWLRAEAENWLAAFRAIALRGDGRDAVDAAERLHWFANLWPRWGGWEAVFATAMQAARGTGRESTMLTYLAWAFHYEQDDLEQGLVAARRAVLTARTLRDVGWAWVHVAAFQLELDDVDTAIASVDRARAALEEAQDVDGLLQTVSLLARAEEQRGDLDAARVRYREVIADARRSAIDLPFSADLARARAWAALAELALRAGEQQDAAAAADEAIRFSRRLQYPLGVARGLRVRAVVAASSARAAEDAATAIAIFESEGEYALADDVRRALLVAEHVVAAEAERLGPATGADAPDPSGDAALDTASADERGPREVLEA